MKSYRSFSRVKSLRDWRTPATAYPNVSVGEAEIKKIEYRNQCCYAEGVKGILFVRYCGRTPITTLEVDGKCWMTDEAPYVWCLQSFAQRSKGKVLVAGLGLGLVAHYLAANPELTEIVIVEKSKDVIDLVGPLLPPDDRRQLVHDDFYCFLKGDEEHRDTVIWDLGLWSPDNDDSMGRQALSIMPALCLIQYGPDCKLFRHGLDRDEEGEQFVREHSEVLEKAKKLVLNG